MPLAERGGCFGGSLPMETSCPAEEAERQCNVNFFLLKCSLLLRFFSCAFSVSFGRTCGVFNLRDALLLGKSLEAPGICWDHPSFSCCCIFGQKSARIGWGRGSRGSASTWDVGCTRRVIPERALWSWEWVKGDVSGCSFCLQLCQTCRVTKAWWQLFR